MAGAGDLAWAVEIAESLPATDRGGAYFSIVSHLADRGDLDTAERLAREKLTALHTRYLVARLIAREHAERRALDRVEKWVESLPTRTERGMALIGAAEGLAGKSFDEPID